MSNWIICPVYNCLPFTQQAVENFLEQDIGDVRVLLVVNKGSDGTGEWLWEQDNLQFFSPQAKYQDKPILAYHPGHNLGVARSWNWALREVFGRVGQQQALVCNNDLSLRADTYRLLDSVAHPPMEAFDEGWGFVSGVGRHTPEEVCVGPIDPRSLVTAPRGGPDFSCFLLQRWFYEQIGPFDEWLYPAYSEDNAYHARAKLLGLTDEIFSVPVPYLHQGGGSAAIKFNFELRQLNQNRGPINRRRYERVFGGWIGQEKFYKPEAAFADEDEGMSL